MVSPILHFQPSSRWRTEIKDFFASMSSLYDLDTNRSCGFHVHLSPGDPSGDRVDWTLDELKNIAMAVVYFEDAFELLIPETRRGSKWHRPNRAQNQAFMGLSTEKCLRRIGEVRDAALLCLMMHQSENSNWNFMNIYAPSGTGTVEFRQPPGVTGAAACLSWAELAVDFVQSARGWPGLSAGIGSYPRTVEGLEQFCYDGMTLGVSNPGCLDPLFAGKSGALEARWADELEDEAALLRKESYDVTHRARL